jgi:predicted HTH transcriptional regulator
MTDAGRIKVQGENKDCDEPPMFLIDVSQKNSGLPKFSWAGDVAQLAGDMKAIGDENREKVFEAFNGCAWKSTKEISLQVSMSRSTVSKHVTALVASGKLEQTGKNPKIKYRITTVRGENPPRTPDGKLFDDNH